MAITDVTKVVNPATAAPDYAGQNTIYAYAGGDSASKDTWTSWKNVNGTHYIFLPSAVSLSGVNLLSTFLGQVRIANTADANDFAVLEPNGMAVHNFDQNATYEVSESGVSQGNLKFMIADGNQGSIITKMRVFKY